MKPFQILAVSSALMMTGTAFAQAQSVDFVSPKDGAVLSSPFKVEFATTGMMVKPAGDMSKDSGHHHLLIDTGSMPAGTPVPADPTHLHFGKGQTETDVKLAPGKHQLTMQFADGAHRSYGPAMAKTITVTVQ